MGSIVSEQEEPTFYTLPKSCLFLGLRDDPATHFSFASSANYCHRVKPIQAVNRTYQDQFCLRESHGLCPVAKPDWSGGLPEELKDRDRARRKRNFSWPALVVVIGVIALLLVTPTIFPGVLPSLTGGNSTQAPTQLAASVTVHFVSAPVSQPSQTATRPVHTPPVSPVVILATSTSRPAVTLTPAPRLEASLTPGPDMETYFGPENRYLLHVVQPGESLPLLAQYYQTSEEVLLASNVTTPGVTTLWAGRILVILPGQTDPQGVVKFEVIYLQEPAQLDNIAALYEVLDEEIRYYNALGPGNWVPSDRWLIIPVIEK